MKIENYRKVWSILMNVKNVMVLVLIFLGLVSSLGCTETISSLRSTPENTLNNYVNQPLVKPS